MSRSGPRRHERLRPARLASTVVLVLLLAWSTAPAQPAPDEPGPTAEEIEAARHHFDQGVALLQTGDHAAALAELTESYRLRPVAVVLKNIALAQKGLFRYAEAIASLERYLAEAPALSADEQAEVHQLIEEMRALLAEITLAVRPNGATITVDGRVVGVAPLDGPLVLASGAHVIEVTAEHHRPVRHELVVAAGVAQTVALELEPVPRTGRVRIWTRVAGATVAIDGKTIGPAPVEVELGVGGHAVEVRAPGHRPHRGELVVAAGQDRKVEIALERQTRARRWHQRWELWAPLAAGASALAIGLGIYYGTTEDPIVGTLQPGVGSVK